MALLLQVPIFLLFTQFAGEEHVVERQQRRVRMQARRYQAPKPRPNTEEPLPEDAQIVEVADSDEPEPEEEVETRHLADRKTRVRRETKTHSPRPPDPIRRHGRTQVEEASSVQSKTSESPEPTATSEDEQNAQMRPSRFARPLSDAGVHRPKSILFEGAQPRIVMPVTTRKARLASLQGISGSFASDDLLRDVQEIADDTLLNANRYRYADFFYRVKDRVRRHWRPDHIYRARDPTGRLYGTKDRYTVLDVTLDAEGRVTKIRTDGRSGLDFMDEEARGAFLRAEIFPNPPDGLVRDGEVRFRFGFFFEIGTGKQRFGWRRL